MTDAPDPRDLIPEADKVMQIIEMIESGSSERAACEHVGMNRGTFRSRALRLGAADHYARSLAALADAQAEALEKTIDDMRAGTIDHQMARVEIDARKWFASKFLPKRYGDKIAHVGGDPAAGDKPIQAQVDVTGLGQAALAALADVKLEGE